MYVIEDGESSEGKKAYKKRLNKDNNKKSNKKAQVVVGNAKKWATRREVAQFGSESMN